MLLSLFSPEGDALALATPDGRLRTYDAGTGRLRATLSNSKDSAPSTSGANGHLMEQHTSMVWAPRKEKKKKGSILVVGTAAGDVKAYDAQLGELKWRCKDCVEGGVASLACSPQQPGLVFVAGADCHIRALDVETGEIKSAFKASRHSITCIAIAPDGKHIFGGGSALSLFDSGSQSRICKFTGHPAPTRSIAFAPNSAFAVSGSGGERHVAIWATQAATVAAAAGKKMGVRPAAGSLSLEQPVLALDACAGPADGPESFHVAAVSEGGDAYVWHCTSAGQQDGRVAGKLLARVSIKGSSGQGTREGIMAVKVQAGSTGPTLLLARGSSAKPTFEQVPISLETEGGEAAQIVLKAADGGVLLGSGMEVEDAAGPAANGIAEAADAKAKRKQKKLQATQNDVTVLGANNMGEPVAMRAVGAEAAASRKRPGQAQEGDEQEAVEAEMAEADDSLDQPEIGGELLGDRVAALEARAGLDGEAGAAAAGEAAAAAAAAGTAGAGAVATPSAAPGGSDKADSLAVLLTQALRAGDKSLLEHCLSASNPRVINNTVARLVPLDAAAFLRTAVDRLLSKPARAVQLAPWIKAVLHHHTAYIMTSPGAQAPLTALYQAIDGRVSLYAQLLRLHGRLGLITAHARAGAATGDEGVDGMVGGRPAPEVVFQDAEESDEEPEAEDAFGGGDYDDEDEEGEGSEGSEDGDEDEDDEDGFDGGMDEDDDDDDE